LSAHNYTYFVDLGVVNWGHFTQLVWHCMAFWLHA